ncbi:hypothetical protein [Burkholderia alba]|uniref:hypothetical protein n=1 Tax=Burkholderia alba TaxID=2683677 RepID=UPI002B052EB3|nr:hypothetical protein [Burkholderia alba]
MTTENSRADALTVQQRQAINLARSFMPNNTRAREEAHAVLETLAASHVEQPAAAPIGRIDRIRVEVHDILANFGQMPPEENETWESWYTAAFDMAAEQIMNAFESTTPAHWYDDEAIRFFVEHQRHRQALRAKPGTQAAPAPVDERAAQELLPRDRKWVTANAVGFLAEYRNCKASETEEVMQQFVAYIQAALQDAAARAASASETGAGTEAAASHAAEVCAHQWTWVDGKCADCGASTQQPTPTTGMTLSERIAHVGGRVTDGGTVEFGSAMAVDALIKHVLRDSRSPAMAANELPHWFDMFLTNVCEISDRNSPEGEPDAIVATLDELRNCALNAIEQCVSYAVPVPAQADAPAEARTTCMCSGLGPCEKRTDGICRLSAPADAGEVAIGFRRRIPGFAWVPWLTDDQDTIRQALADARSIGFDAGELYAAPPTAKVPSLTDEQRKGVEFALGLAESLTVRDDKLAASLRTLLQGDSK